MGEYEVMHACLDAGISLTLSDDSERIVARPASNLTPEIRERIRENKDGILRCLLFKRAVFWLSEKTMHQEEALRNRVWEVFGKDPDELEAAWCDASLEWFREVLHGCLARTASFAGSTHVRGEAVKSEKGAA